jgi:hypothetical protein
MFCTLCNQSFKQLYNYNKHLNTIKHLSKVPIEESDTRELCPFCNYKYSNIKLHINKCKTSMEVIYRVFLERENIITEKENIIVSKEAEINDLKAQIKDLQDKLFTIANKTTTVINNRSSTYNTILNCSKPLLLNKERIQELLNTYCDITYLKHKSKGLAKFFIENIAVNSEGKVCIECVDKNRKIFKYKDENDVLKQITGNELYALIRPCFIKFKETDNYKAFIQYITETESSTEIERYDKAFNDSKKFIDYLSDRTYNDSFNSVLVNSVDE